MVDSRITGVHHLGVAVKSIKDESRSYIDLMGFRAETKILHEPPQKVFVQFFTLAGLRIELIEPSSEDSPIINFMNKGGVLNHICYETTDIDLTVQSLRSNKSFFQTVGITKASTLDDCFYSFFAKPSGEVIELIFFDKKRK